MAVDIMDEGLDCEETNFLDKDFSNQETKGLVSLSVVPMESKGQDIPLQGENVNSIECWDKNSVKDIDYSYCSNN